MKKPLSLILVLVVLASACNFTPQQTPAPTLPPTTNPLLESTATSTPVPATPTLPAPTGTATVEASPAPVAYGPPGFPPDLHPPACIPG